MSIDKLIELDKYWLLSLNGSDSLFWDGFMMVYTSTVVWFPLAAALLYVLIKNNTIKQFFLLLAMIALVFVLTDGITSTFCKPFFARFRPTNDPELMYFVDVVNNYRRALYGFMSSHAANSFGIATFCMLIIRNRALSVSLVLWALLTGYSRIYLGVHYPGDVICGSIVGILSGFAIYALYKYLCRKVKFTAREWISTQYTRSGYLVSDIHLLLMVLYGTLAIIPIWAFFKIESF